MQYATARDGFNTDGEIEKPSNGNFYAQKFPYWLSFIGGVQHRTYGKF